MFRNTVRVSSGLDPDQYGHSVGPDLCPNRLQRVSADDSHCRFRTVPIISGVKHFVRDLELMIGKKPKIFWSYWVIMWLVVTPIVIMVYK